MCSKFYYLASIASRFLGTFLFERIFFFSRLGGSVTPFEPLFLFQLFSFLHFFHFPNFLFSLKIVFLFFPLFHKHMPLQKGLTKDVSSVVGAPWRCGVLTT